MKFLNEKFSEQMDLLAKMIQMPGPKISHPDPACHFFRMCIKDDGFDAAVRFINHLKKRFANSVDSVTGKTHRTLWDQLHKQLVNFT